MVKRHSRLILLATYASGRTRFKVCDIRMQKIRSIGYYDTTTKAEKACFIGREDEEQEEESLTLV